MQAKVFKLLNIVRPEYDSAVKTYLSDHDSDTFRQYKAEMAEFIEKLKLENNVQIPIDKSDTERVVKAF